MCSQKTFLSAEVNNLKKRIYISLSRIIYFRGWLFYLHMDKMIYDFISELANDLVPFDDYQLHRQVFNIDYCSLESRLTNGQCNIYIITIIQYLLYKIMMAN